MLGGLLKKILLSLRAVIVLCLFRLATRLLESDDDAGPSAAHEHAGATLSAS